MCSSDLSCSPAAQELEASFAALAQLRRLQVGRAAVAETKLGLGCSVNQEEIAILVLYRDTGGQQPHDVAQQTQFSISRALVIGGGFGGVRRKGKTLHVSGF